MYLVEKHIINKSHTQWAECDRLCFLSKNLYNQALYRVRQHYFETKTTKKIVELDKEMIVENQVDYRAISAKSSQTILRLVDQNMKSFFASLRAFKKQPEKFKARPQIPKYKDKTKGRCVISFDYIQVKVKDGFIKFPKKENLLPLKTKIKPEEFKLVRIIPAASCYVIEVVYEKKEVKNENLDYKKYIALDLGINNLCAITSNQPGFKPLLINGKTIKSINQHYNKLLAKHSSNLKNQKKKTSNKIQKTTIKRNNRISTHLHVMSKFIIDLCNHYNIGNIIIGKNDGWKQEVNLGKKTNQKFVQVPFESFISKLEYKAEFLGIKVKKTEESYTSKCSALDQEEICKHEEYVGKRIKRGLFRIKSGKTINADINGSLNILRKVIGDDFIVRLDTASAAKPLLINPLKSNFQKILEQQKIPLNLNFNSKDTDFFSSKTVGYNTAIVSYQQTV